MNERPTTPLKSGSRRTLALGLLATYLPNAAAAAAKAAGSAPAAAAPLAAEVVQALDAVRKALLNLDATCAKKVCSVAPRPKPKLPPDERAAVLHATKLMSDWWDLK